MYWSSSNTDLLIRLELTQDILGPSSILILGSYYLTAEYSIALKTVHKIKNAS